MTEGIDDRLRDKLLYRALAEFSDACDIPDLTPSCPFYQISGQGSPICAEECKDILGDDLSHAASADTLSLGNDLAAVRAHVPRPRREPSDGAMVFDARQVYLVERAKSVSNWSMTALVYAVGCHVAWMRDRDDVEGGPTFDQVIGELTARGVDAEAVVRQGMFHRILTAILWKVLRAVRDSDDSAGWLSAARIGVPDLDPSAYDEQDDIEDRVEDVISQALMPWILSAPLEYLVEHRFAASGDELALVRESLPDRDYDAMWLVDRFTSTYVRQWQKSSMQREWNYVRSMRPGCCVSGYMRERFVDPGQLAELLAEVGADHLSEREAERDGNRLARHVRVDQFLPLAIESLGRGDHAEAARIYELVNRVRPGDSEVENNLGFCLLPSDPARAVELLEGALAHQSGVQQSMTRLNICIGWMLQDELAKASSALIQAIDSDLSPFDGWMWEPEKALSGHWALIQIEGSLDEYATQVAHALRCAAE